MEGVETMDRLTKIANTHECISYVSHHAHLFPQPLLAVVLKSSRGTLRKHLLSKMFCLSVVVWLVLYS